MARKVKPELRTSTALQPYVNMKKATEINPDIKSRVESQRQFKVPATPAAKPGLKHNTCIHLDI